MQLSSSFCLLADIENCYDNQASNLSKQAESILVASA